MREVKQQRILHAPRIEFAVTEAAINEGIRANSNHCMVADAIHAAYPELQYVSVDIQTIRATDKKKRRRYIWLTPRKVQELIVRFDQGLRPQPFKIRLQDGHVNELGPNNEAAKRAKKKYAAKVKGKKKARLGKARGGNNHTVPIGNNGPVPPRSIGARRQYGIRGMDVAPAT